MRVVIQRVSEASVTINNELHAFIKKGLLILLGVEDADTEEDAIWLASKISKMRIFNDHLGLMNLSLSEVDGEALVISQFTLHAETRKGNRPSFIRAARPEKAVPLYQKFIQHLELELGHFIKSGQFGADMKVSLINDGPVTITMDSKNKE